MYTKIEPLKVIPIFKKYLWGGNKLFFEYGKIERYIAESWELSYRNNEVSRFINEADISYYSKFNEESFPCLVKLIDANSDLSIQVHPSNINKIPENNEQGKLELWYIVDCSKDAYIYYGFKKNIKKESFKELCVSGEICDYLNKISVKKGDSFIIEPGIIHAIGKGNLIAEIQQNSDTTFRIYDYNRVDSSGNKRELNIDRAFDVTNFEVILPNDLKSNISANFNEYTFQELYTCKYFNVYLLKIRNNIDIECKNDEFNHLLCVNGDGKIIYNGIRYEIKKGDSYYIQREIESYCIMGECTILLTR